MYLTHNSATTQYIHEGVHVALMMVIKKIEEIITNIFFVQVS